jgi:hypothetical protein
MNPWYHFGYHPEGIVVRKKQLTFIRTLFYCLGVLTSFSEAKQHRAR